MQYFFFFPLKTWHLQRVSLLGCHSSRAPRTPTAANAAASERSRNHRLFPCRKPGRAQNICYFTSVLLCPAKPTALKCRQIAAYCRIFEHRNPKKERGCRTVVPAVILRRAVCREAGSELTSCSAVAWRYKSPSLHERCPRSGENCQAATRRRHRGTPIGTVLHLPLRLPLL